MWLKYRMPLRKWFAAYLKITCNPASSIIPDNSTFVFIALPFQCPCLFPARGGSWFLHTVWKPQIEEICPDAEREVTMHFSFPSQFQKYHHLLGCVKESPWSCVHCYPWSRSRMSALLCLSYFLGKNTWVSPSVGTMFFKSPACRGQQLKRKENWW